MGTTFAGGVTAAQLTKLAEPTPPDEIGLIPGKGGSGKLSYVTARFVQNRLDDALGPQNWSSEFRIIGNSLTCIIAVLVGTEWVRKQDVGSESQIEAEKGSFSDAFKRTGVQWGIARDLYPGPKETMAAQEEAQAARDARKAERAKDTTPRTQRGKRSTETAVPQAVEQGTSVEQAVEGEVLEQKAVGDSGLSDKQRKLLMATLRGAGLKPKRKAAVFLMTSKQSVKDMDGTDLNRVLAIIEYGADGEGNAEFDEVWDNIDLVEADVQG